MKKIILFLSAILSAILMTSMVYADSGNIFYPFIMNKDGIIYYTGNGAGDIKLPNEADTFYITDDYIYYTVYNKYDYSTVDLYRCNKDFSEKTLLANCSPYYLFYYNNSIYYTSSIYNGKVLYSINTETLETKKYLTYTGTLNILSINNDYIYFGAVDSSYYATKLYKMNINDRTDKKLIYLTQKEYIYECFAAGNKIYIDTGTDIKIMDETTGQILNTINYNNLILYIAGQVNGTVYLYDTTGKIYYIDNNNSLQLLAEGTYITNKSDMFGESISNNCIYLYTYDFDNEIYKIYEYSIPENKFTEIN